MSAWSRDNAELFVRKLFEHVMHNDAPRPEWISAWTERALQLGSAEKTFGAFVSTPEYIERLEAIRDARPHWPAGHFYSPIVSRRELEGDAARVFARGSLPGINLRTTAQLDLLVAFLPYFSTMPFPEKRSEPFRYRFDNGSYGFGDALIYWCMLNTLRPHRIFEIGSGFTSALALDAIQHINLTTTCTFVDPYPEFAERIIDKISRPHQIIKSRAQDLDLNLFDQLERNDILFIDSTHIVKTGSDVHFELTQILPRLKAGVVIHFHDIFSGFEYPRGWALEQNYSWNEVYALHFFLQYNTDFEIKFFNHHIATEHRKELQSLRLPQADRFLVNPGGGLWLRRR